MVIIIRYLLAAEVDKIQDFIFRASKLRQVVGGSLLLTRFCKEVPKHLLERYGGDIERDIIISAGGSFRILFDSMGDAIDFGNDLAEVYRRATDGSLSVAEPVNVNSNFGEASEKAENNLRRAKRGNKGWQATPHIPYAAFCASCGLGLAVENDKLHFKDDRSLYLCRSCLAKKDEAGQKSISGSFLEMFFKDVSSDFDAEKYGWPGKEVAEDLKGPDPIEDLSLYDNRGYVAYLLADGNDMGKLFGSCKTEEQVRALSKGVNKALNKALAAPTSEAMKRSVEDNFIPALPLILGGDDLFALIPAPWALDFANRFSREYQNQMEACLKHNLFADMRDELPKPTVSTAVVICKGKYPYSLAHQAGENRLKEAKRVSRMLALNGVRLSSVNYEVILSNRLVRSPEKSNVRPTLRPYWSNSKDIPEGWGLPIQCIIDQRRKLSCIASKRLSELSRLYDYPAIPKDLVHDDFKIWLQSLSHLLERIGRSEEQKTLVEKALRALGGKEEANWYSINYGSKEFWNGHGLPDLLEAWDFALSLDYDKKYYGVERCLSR
jgi:hypothetical protein